MRRCSLNDYDIEIIEAHHNQKKDAPSGTALAAVDVLKNAAGIAEDSSTAGRVWLCEERR